MKNIFYLLKNKYFISSVAFAIWMIFFDRNDIPSQFQYSKQIQNLKMERDFYIEETAIVKQDLEELTSNLNRLQKFAREKYLMKKDNEDIFVLTYPPNQ